MLFKICRIFKYDLKKINIHQLHKINEIDSVFALFNQKAREIILCVKKIINKALNKLNFLDNILMV
ncbi:hypothetical protein RM51_11250 [Chryseobacterium taiwanense]|uniref:Uncharacterized protein n=1 Tax=Chryseobacterium taiwanense TaxID=363331 RepID=A0A0B4CNE8_9FLAO|nr:hypothetical protein RM51_11250 [Chryseobacterium taiwanense]